MWTHTVQHESACFPLAEMRIIIQLDWAYDKYQWLYPRRLLRNKEHVRGEEVGWVVARDSVATRGECCAVHRVVLQTVYKSSAMPEA